MSVPSEMSRLKRDLASFEEEIAVSSGPRAKSPMTADERRKVRAEIQMLIQKLDELSQRLAV